MPKIQERMVLFPSGENTLEGLYHKGPTSPGIVVAGPHPKLGGSMDSPVVAEIAYAAARDRHPTLRFNYRGVGASQGEPAGDLSESGDLLAAIEELRATGGAREIVLAGYSYGSRLILDTAVEEPELSGAILVSPPTTLDYSRVRSLRIPTLIIAGTKDDYVDWPALRDLVTGLAAVHLVEIPEAGHFFDRGLVALSRAIAGFMARIAP